MVRVGLLSIQFLTPSSKLLNTYASPRATTTPSDGVVVEIEAGLLLKRSDQSDWTSKVIPMRAVCDAGRMDRQDSSGTWNAYPARPDTPVKVAWMCSLP